MNSHLRHPLRIFHAFRHRVTRALHLDAWFPHVPIAMAVGLSGLMQINQTLTLIEDFFALPQQTIEQFTGEFSSLAIRGIPHDVIGVLLVIMSIGLLMRSRLAWMVTLLMSIASLLLELTPLASQPLSLELFHGVVLILLILNRQHFQRASLTTGTLFSIAGVLLTLGFGVIGSYVLGAQFKPAITDFPTALYFTIVSMSTVGYGDITAQTTEARMFTISLIILGLLVFATSLTAILGPMMNQQIMKLIQPRRKTMQRKDHIIVVGNGPFARNAADSLQSRGLTVTRVLATAPASDTEESDDFIVGDGGDSDILLQAQADTARAVLALTEDDSNNAFTILAAREVNENIKTVIAVSDAHNLNKIKRVHPDVVLALPVIGAELLAMALSGEEIKTDALFEQLLKLD
jgi:voltage-gated potassium channel